MNGGESPPLVVTPSAQMEDHPHSRPHESRTVVVVVVVLATLAKGAAYTSLLNHPASVLVLCGVLGVVWLLRGRLVTAAVAGAVIVPVAISPGSVAVGIAMGAAAFVALMTVFVAIGTLLEVAERRTSRRARAARRG